jgi:hypothetical protein
VEFACRTEFLPLGAYRAIGFAKLTPPSALAAALRVFRPQAASAVASNRDSSSRRLQRSSRVLTSTVTSLAHRVNGEPTEAPLMGFASLQHMPATRVHDPRALPDARCVPSSGFGYPRDGLLPSTPGRASFISTAFLGFPPAEPSPPGRWDGVSPNAGPTCRFDGDLLRRDEAHRPDIAITSSWALALPRSSMIRRGCLANSELVAPLGFCPSRVLLPDALPTGSRPRAPLTRFAETAEAEPAGDLGYRSATDWLNSHPHRQARAAKLSNPHRVLVPA